MTVPAEYNDVSLSISPTGIYDIGLNVKTTGEEVISALQKINNTLNDLQLGWNGTSAAEAKDFADQWTAAMTNLFGDGSGDSSGAGVLNQVIATLLTAGGNYGAADGNVASMFNSLASGLSAPGGGGPDSAPIPAGGPLTDGSLSSVGETGWTAIA
jgi:hypothetical protein